MMELPGKDVYGIGLDFAVRKINQDFRLFLAKTKDGLTPKNLKKLFKEYDKNGNGTLELEEFEVCLASQGVFLKKFEY